MLNEFVEHGMPPDDAVVSPVLVHGPPVLVEYDSLSVVDGQLELKVPANPGSPAVWMVLPVVHSELVSVRHA